MKKWARQQSQHGGCKGIKFSSYLEPYKVNTIHVFWPGILLLYTSYCNLVFCCFHHYDNLHNLPFSCRNFNRRLKKLEIANLPTTNQNSYLLSSLVLSGKTSLFDECNWLYFSTINVHYQTQTPPLVPNVWKEKFKFTKCPQNSSNRLL